MSPDLHTTSGKIEDLRLRVEEAIHAGSARAVEKQHAKGKLTARERIDLLVDADSFTEIDEFARHRSTQFGMEKNRPYGDGVVIGTATVDGRPIALYSQDFTVMGGSLGEVHAEKIVKIAEFALKSGIPLIGINDSGGARIQEGVASLNGYGKIFRLNTRSSGVIPQISLILGPCAGGSAYSPALTGPAGGDFFHRPGGAGGSGTGRGWRPRQRGTDRQGARGNGAESALAAPVPALRQQGGAGRSRRLAADIKTGARRHRADFSGDAGTGQRGHPDRCAAGRAAGGLGGGAARAFC